ncbi:hypothetical protein VIBNISFn27_1080007 [Vibrio nigripulchritudo SFn27]|uniref:Uncharacterized protein n=1 Tax=Vibrio nigripulchritudo TaxID=28173 RepID=U4KIG4_9VIBR|nr:hypothetical protein VIBNIBLFn1_760007 [Vibrio nigripulchritudo BLFn1]CCN86463.1 hypothetical protein VIBNISFn27_1080007 [Vibrio nigripulchritudo SFn27]CCN97004.1 hypothetical protein VIBNIENn2_870007 [Vibrio nigripulchritudo ENn2]CCO41636.1 hypothetical protein VIBNISFn135_560069 [Vibrio nigripulchritudo SFn135]CCO54241.1 hypothetical protein VIBNIWn13_660068 [Vibrio nigripulchritudo Wn13]CCO60635.1 hypothetical protein VIBNI_B0849 [Vibrio nigripulchritudo]
MKVSYRKKKLVFCYTLIFFTTINAFRDTVYLNEIKHSIKKGMKPTAFLSIILSPKRLRFTPRVKFLLLGS